MVHLGPFKKVANLATALLFLERCRGCGARILPGQEPSGLTGGRHFARERSVMCRDDASRVLEIPCLKAICHLCWRGFFDDSLSLDWCQLSSDSLFAVASGCFYRGAAKRIVYKLKYDNDRLVAGDLSYVLERAWSNMKLEVAGRTVVLVPVPLHKARLQKRGYNQAELLACRAGRLIGLPVEGKALERVKATTAQHGLGRIERLSNLEGAFRANEQKIRGKFIVLVDDVLTSGATLAEAARVVAAAGAAGVAGLTVCRATLGRKDA